MHYSVPDNLVGKSSLYLQNCTARKSDENFISPLLYKSGIYLNSQCRCNVASYLSLQDTKDRTYQKNIGNPYMIELKNIHKTYYGGAEVPLHVLKGVSLTIEQGEFLCIMGASGSGKSTLLNICRRFLLSFFHKVPFYKLVQ